ncbi:MAG TPA: hypothetical protein VK360_06745 [Acidimicrobiales bacterium]|nr:hypothetical protein [Acidimicrobiales bacterium]
MAGDGSDQAEGVPPPSPELERLAPLVQEWVAEDHTLDSVLGPGVPVISAETLTWFDGGYFLVSTYETVFGDEPPQRGVSLGLRRGGREVPQHLLQQRRPVHRGGQP